MVRTASADTSLRVEKIVAHADHLLTAFIQLRERYSLLHPMLFHEHVPKQYGSFRQARGFTILKTSLFLSCCQDIAKISTDFHKDGKTPSIKRIMNQLLVDEIRGDFRRRYCEGRPMFGSVDDDPALQEVYGRMTLDYAHQQGLEFDRNYELSKRCWEALEQSPAIQGFRTIRDTVTAHTEIRRHADSGIYRPVDIGELGITWGDLKRTIDAMQTLVELIGRLTRDASFAWDSLDRALNQAGSDFWADRSLATAS